MSKVTHDTICPVCQENFYEQIYRGTLDDQIMESHPCDHVFHMKCIAMAYLVNAKCPLCRVNMYGGGTDITKEVEDEQYQAANEHFLK